MDPSSPSPAPSPQPSNEQRSLPATPSVTPFNNPEVSPIKKPSWVRRHKILTVLIVIGVLFILGALSPNKHKNAPLTNQASSGQTQQTTGNTPQLSTVNGLAPVPVSSKAPVNEKTYFQTVWSHLDTIGKLSQTMNQSCTVKFPPPEPCASDIQAYQQELLNTKSDLDQVSAPVSFQQADTTLRNALDTDIQATNQALDAIQTRSWTKWVAALNQHGQAGRELNQAGAQALDVLR